jgi:hypothetical protein
MDIFSDLKFATCFGKSCITIAIGKKKSTIKHSNVSIYVLRNCLLFNFEMISKPRNFLIKLSNIKINHTHTFVASLHLW